MLKHLLRCLAVRKSSHKAGEEVRVPKPELCKLLLLLLLLAGQVWQDEPGVMVITVNMSGFKNHHGNRPLDISVSEIFKMGLLS